MRAARDELLEHAEDALQTHERRHVRLPVPQRRHQQRGEDPDVRGRERAARVRLDQLRQELEHVRRELDDVRLQDVLKRRKQRALEPADESRVVRVPQERGDGLEEVVRERRVPRVLARLHRHRRELRHARVRDGLDAFAQEPDHAHHRSHRVIVLPAVRLGEDAEQRREQRLRRRREVRGRVPRRRARDGAGGGTWAQRISRRQKAVESDGGVGVDDVVFRAKQRDDGGDDREDHRLGQLMPEDGHELERVREQHRLADPAGVGPLTGRFRELRDDLGLEKVHDGDELVRLRRALRGAALLHRERDDQIDRRVFRFPRVHRVGRELTEKRGDVPGHAGRHLVRKLPGEAFDELARAASTRVAVAPFHVPTDVLHVVHLEQLLVVVAELQVRDDDALAHLTQRVAPREERVMHGVGNRGQEPHAGRHEVILLRARARLREQRPDVLDERLKEPLELLLVLLDVQVDVVAHRGFDAVELGDVSRGWIFVGEVFVKLTHPRVHRVLEHLRELLRVEGVKHAHDKTQTREQRRQERRVVRVGVHGGGDLQEQRLQRRHERVQDVLQLLIQLVALVRLAIALEHRVRGREDAHHGVEVALPRRPHALNQLREQRWPPLRKIRGADDGQRLGVVPYERTSGWS
eukprot:31065-Pelagococcus_subviridis.AAC.5